MLELMEAVWKKRKSDGILPELRPLSYVMKVFGLFPADVRGHNMRFSYTSPITTYSLLMIIIPFAIPFSIVVIRHPAGQKIQLSLYGVQLWISGLPCVLSFVHISRLVELLQATDSLLPTRPLSRTPLHWPALSIIAYLLSVAGTFYFTYNGGVVQALTRFTLALIWQRDAQQAILFAFFVCHIRARFTTVRGMLSMPERCRQAHGTLAECVRQLSKAFGLRFLLSILSIGSDYLFNVYVNTYHHQASASLEIFYLGALDALWNIYMPAHLATKLAEEGNAIEDDILKISTVNKDEKYLRQIELLLEEVKMNRLEISAWGVFKIDSGLYGAFLNTLLTFFIAMAQFSKEIAAMIERYNLNN